MGLMDSMDDGGYPNSTTTLGDGGNGVGGLILPEGVSTGLTGPSKVLATLAELEARTMDDLQEVAKELELTGLSRIKKHDLALRILQAQTEEQGNIFKRGILDVMDDGFGFMRVQSYLPSPNDVYVSQSQIRRFSLRPGDMVLGQGAPAQRRREILQPFARRSGQRP